MLYLLFIIISAFYDFLPMLNKLFMCLHIDILYWILGGEIEEFWDLENKLVMSQYAKDFLQCSRE